MFKRSLASVAAVAIASGAVVAPANAVAVKVNDDMYCTFSFTAEEAKLTNLKSKKYSKGQITYLKSAVAGSQPSALRKQIEKDQKKLTESSLDATEKEKLTRQLEENKKKLTVYENLNNALDACINGKYYNSDNLGDSKNPEDQGNPGDSKNPEDQGNPGESKQPEDQGNPGESKQPEDQGNPGAPGKPGDSNNPGPNNPGVQPAPPSNDGAGIGVIFAGAIAAILGILAAALPIIKPMLPPQLRALLP
ncbi:collagen-like triple helix repeat-containing protein [Corynebacterium diphtheriae]